MFSFHVSARFDLELWSFEIDAIELYRTKESGKQRRTC